MIARAQRRRSNDELPRSRRRSENRVQRVVGRRLRRRSAAVARHVAEALVPDRRAQEAVLPDHREGEMAARRAAVTPVAVQAGGPVAVRAVRVDADRA